MICLKLDNEQLNDLSVGEMAYLSALIINNGIHEGVANKSVQCGTQTLYYVLPKKGYGRIVCCRLKRIAFYDCRKNELELLGFFSLSLAVALKHISFVAKVLNSTVQLDTAEQYTPGIIDAYFPLYSEAYLKSSEIKEMFVFRGSDQQLVEQFTENFNKLIEDLPERKLARLSALSYILYYIRPTSVSRSHTSARVDAAV